VRLRREKKEKWLRGMKKKEANKKERRDGLHETKEKESLKAKKQISMSIFMQKKVILKELFLITSLQLYFYIKRHVLTLTILIILFIILLFLCWRNMKMYSFMMFLMVCCKSGEQTHQIDHIPISIIPN